MKNKKNKKLLIILGIVLLLVIVGGIIFVLRNSDVIEEKPKPPVAQMGGTSGDGSYIYGWKENLDGLIYEKFLEIFPEDYDFKLKVNQSFTITLEDMQEHFDADLSDFNTETIKCNLEKSYFKVYRTDEGEFMTSNLECENLEENNN